LDIILLYIFAYILGSIPTAVWVGKAFFDTDVRDFGSGNAGATNTFRVLGKKAGIPVLICDILKSFAAVKLSFLIVEEPSIALQLGLGITAVLGHIFPVFAKFKGGKGIASLLGLILAVYPEAAALSILVFAVFFLLTKYVSLGSIMAAFSLPIWMIILGIQDRPSLLFGMAITCIVLISHQKNIERLTRREENKIRLVKRK
jgi:glycerol-3-phosphate acyltransferase PlsY